LPAHCCQPAVAGGIIYEDLWGELSTHLALQALFTQRSLVCEPLLQASPFPSTVGKVTLHPLSQACVFTYSSCGKWVFSPLLWSFPPTATFTSFPAPDYWAVLLLLPAAMFLYSSRGKWVFPPLLWCFPTSATLTSFPTPGCWAHAPAPTGASPACPACLFTVPGRIPFPQSSALSVPHPLSHVSLLFLLLITQFLFFPRVEVGLLWPRVVCGNTAVPRSSPCPHLPKPSGHGRLVARVPSFFLHLTWSGDFLHQLEVWRGQSFASSTWFCLQSVSPVSLQDFTIGGSLSASSL
jgi:hypothetical protein